MCCFINTFTLQNADQVPTALGRSQRRRNQYHNVSTDKKHLNISLRRLYVINVRDIGQAARPKHQHLKSTTYLHNFLLSLLINLSGSHGLLHFAKNHVQMLIERLQLKSDSL